MISFIYHLINKKKKNIMSKISKSFKHKKNDQGISTISSNRILILLLLSFESS